MGILRLSVSGTKVLLAGGFLYYSNEFGIWGNINETEKGYARLKEVIQNNQYNQKIKEITSEYMAESKITEQVQELDIKSKIPNLPTSSQLQSGWNKGVETTFDFISNSPSLLNGFAAQAQTLIGQQIKDAVRAEPQAIPEIAPKSTKEGTSETR